MPPRENKRGKTINWSNSEGLFPEGTSDLHQRLRRTGGKDLETKKHKKKGGKRGNKNRSK